MKPLQFVAFTLIILQLSCSSDNSLSTPGGGGVNTPGEVDVTAKVWQLYSKDLVIVNGTQKAYASRAVLTDCFETINFVTTDSLLQADSCAGTPPTTLHGSWHAYSATSMQVQVFTSKEDEQFKSLFSLTKDTMQLRVLPDSITDVTNQRILTYRAIPK